MMLYTESCNSNPYFNAALEEYLFREKEGADFLLTCVNSPSVIVGRSNNILGNLIYKYFQKNPISIVRGFSEGINLYTDMGCVGFTLITNKSYKTSATFVYRSFLNKLNDVLNEIGFPTHISKKNELSYNGMTILACNNYTSGKRSVIRCVLYLQANLNNLNKIFSKKNKYYLSSNSEKQKELYGNVLYNLKATELDKIKDEITQKLSAGFCSSQTYQLTDYEYNEVVGLMMEKYMTWEWNFAQDYEYLRKCSVSKNSLSIYLKVCKGIITLSRVLVNNNPLFSGSNPLTGLQHAEHDISTFFTRYKKHIHKLGISSNHLASYFF